MHVRHPRRVKVGDGGYWVDLLGSAFLAVVNKHDIHFPGIHTSERVVVIVGREMHVIGAGTHLFADMVTGECWDGDDDSIGKKLNHSVLTESSLFRKYARPLDAHIVCGNGSSRSVNNQFEISVFKAR